MVTPSRKLIEGWRSSFVGPPRPFHGPGTELYHLLRRLGIKELSGCPCKSVMAEMNAWGVDGCKARAAEFAASLRERSAEYGLLDKLKAAALALATGLASRLDWNDPYPGLVQEAIRRAEAATNSPPAGLD